MGQEQIKAIIVRVKFELLSHSGAILNCKQRGLNDCHATANWHSFSRFFKEIHKLNVYFCVSVFIPVLQQAQFFPCTRHCLERGFR